MSSVGSFFSYVNDARSHEPEACIFIRRDRSLDIGIVIKRNRMDQNRDSEIGLVTKRGPSSSVGIETELRAGRSGDRLPVGVRFSAPVQTGPEDHPASCTMDTGSFLEVSCGRGVTLTPHPF